MFTGKWSNEATKTGSQASRQTSRELAVARRGQTESRWERGRNESGLGGVNDPWFYYLMSSSGDVNSTAE